MIDQSQICAMLPHEGTMCLLDRVEEHTAERIVCLATTHRDSDNPLRYAGGLPAICGIEYAAQAMAVHGILTQCESGDRPSSGYLAAIRNLSLSSVDLATLTDDMQIEATLVAGMQDAFSYQCRIVVGSRQVLEARLTGRLIFLGDK